MTPFLKWPGGKRWFVFNHAELLPVEFRVYHEPFLGSGAVFFHLNPQRAVLSDTNRELIATYRAIKSDALAIERRLRRHQSMHDDDHYYRTRNAPRTDDLRTEAARFLYLNRTCFNGIYRVNLQGVFNVPRGTKTSVVLPTDNFAEVRRLLWRAKLESCDFEPAIDRAEPGDLVFADPPYTVRHNNNGFVKYNETLFSWADQERLAAALGRAAYRGVKVVATNADHDEVRNLYAQRCFQLTSVKRYSSISSSRESRKAFAELVIRANCK